MSFLDDQPIKTPYVDPLFVEQQEAAFKRGLAEGRNQASLIRDRSSARYDLLRSFGTFAFWFMALVGVVALGWVLISSWFKNSSERREFKEVQSDKYLECVKVNPKDQCCDFSEDPESCKVQTCLESDQSGNHCCLQYDARTLQYQKCEEMYE